MFRSAAALCLAATWMISGTAALADPPPTVVQAICRPTFQVEGKALPAGTAFAVDWDGATPRSILVSAMHLFGPLGGLAKQITWSEVAAKVTSVACASVAGKTVLHSDHALTMQGAQAMDQGYLRDLSAFALSTPGQGTQSPHLKLARQAPKSGDSVWLVAQVMKGAPATQLLHHAVVTYAKDDALQYKFDNNDLSIQATSGAPVVNADGDVVGVNLGGGRNNGAVSGTADSLTSIRALLESAK